MARAARAPRVRKAKEAAPPVPQRDYLVIYEEPDESGLPVDDDSLTLDIEQGTRTPMGEIDVQQRLDLELRNDVNRIGTFGFILCLLGGLGGLTLMVAFAMTFPDGYYNDNRTIDTSVVPPMLGGSMASFLFLLVGTIVTHYGRRIQARGNLSAVRIVEKAPSQRAGFED